MLFIIDTSQKREKPSRLGWRWENTIKICKLGREFKKFRLRPLGELFKTRRCNRGPSEINVTRMIPWSGIPFAKVAVSELNSVHYSVQKNHTK
jgi:hypothetical protein